jgi:hypothetical protein
MEVVPPNRELSFPKSSIALLQSVETAKPVYHKLMEWMRNSRCRLSVCVDRKFWVALTAETRRDGAALVAGSMIGRVSFANEKTCAGGPGQYRVAIVQEADIPAINAQGIIQGSCTDAI